MIPRRRRSVYVALLAMSACYDTNSAMGLQWGIAVSIESHNDAAFGERRPSE